MRDRKGGDVHSEKIREKCDQCSSFLTGSESPLDSEDDEYPSDPLELMGNVEAV